MIKVKLNKSAKEMITKDYVKQLEEENAELLRKIVAAKEYMEQALREIENGEEYDAEATLKHGIEALANGGAE